MAHVDMDWRYRDLQVVRLRNDRLCVDVLPELGAKIYNFVHSPSGRNLLWHNPRVGPARQAFGSTFDDTWSGGWDELIPNDLPSPEPQGDLLPDHGEVWSQPAKVDVLQDAGPQVSVRFTTLTRVLPIRFEKTLTLRDGEPVLRIHYRLTNQGPARYDFVWNIHPAMAISPDSWIDLPAREGFTDPWRQEQFADHSPIAWPNVSDRQGRRIDLRQVLPPESGLADMHYLTGVREGWYAVTDRRAKVGFGLVFPTSVLPNVWLFRTFGGWRGLYTLILEASNGCSRDLREARNTGQCGRLESGQTLEADVLGVAYSGVTGVSRIDSDGRVTPA